MKYVTVTFAEEGFRKMANNTVNVEYGHCPHEVIMAQESAGEPEFLVRLLQGGFHHGEPFLYDQTGDLCFFAVRSRVRC